jgi:small redox-active disulfide protein 2
MEIKVLGSGCPKCKKLYAEAEQAIQDTGIKASLTKVEKMDEILKFGVMSTPALVIDGQVKCSGRLAFAKEIATILYKRILTGCLLVFVIATLGVVIARAKNTPAAESAAPGSGVSRNLAQQPDELNGRAIPGIAVTDATRVVAMYFMTSARCTSCLKIESFTREAIESGFSQELKDGVIILKTINVESPENQHFVSNYQLYSKTVVIAGVEKGLQQRWKNLERVWDMLDDKQAFMSYVQTEMKQMLAAPKGS